MSQKDVTQITVDGQPVGILGLKEALSEVASLNPGLGDEQIGQRLLSLLSKSNYIPDRVKDAYKEAFVREYKKMTGAAFEEDKEAGLSVKVLGPGCPNCDRLENELMAVMAELNLQGSLEHVRDIKEIGKYGVMGSPALVINGKVKCVGRVPPRSQLKEWLKQP
jgi:small redox-active disulfide protein 2